MSGSTIRRSTAIGTAAAGTLLLALVPSGAVQAAPAGASAVVAPAATCKITSYAPSKVAVGAKTVKKTFSVKASGCSSAGWDVVVFPYNSNLDKGLFASEESPSISFVPKTFTNNDAGKHVNGALVSVSAGAQLNTTFSLVRQATWGKTLNATPEPVKKGKTLTVKATLKRVSWTKGLPLVTYSNRPVVLQFKAKGATTYKNVKTVKTGSGGKVSTTVKASKTGTWRFSFAGNSTTSSAVSTGDAVTVK
jgi:hypothetical protein